MRTLSFLIAAVLLMAASPALAAGDSLSLDATDNGDGTYTVDVMLSADESITAMQFGISYDSDKLRLIGTSQGDALSGGLHVVNDQAEDAVYFAWANATDMAVSEGRPVLRLTFQPIGGGPVQVGFDSSYDNMVCGKDMNELSLTTQGTSIQSGASGGSSQTQTAQPSSTPSAPVATILPEQQGGENTAQPEQPEQPGQSSQPSGTAAVTPPPAKEGVGIKLDSTAVALMPGETYLFTITADNPNASLFWYSSNERVATVGPDGSVTAHDAGSAIISVMSDDLTMRAEAVVTVSGVPQRIGVAEARVESATEYPVTVLDVMVTQEPSSPAWPFVALGGALLAGALGAFVYARRRR